MDICDFDHWEIYYQAEKSLTPLGTLDKASIITTVNHPWTLLPGHGDGTLARPWTLVERCISGFNATGLASYTFYRFKIRPICANQPLPLRAGVGLPGLGDQDSDPTPWLPTLPLPAVKAFMPLLDTSTPSKLSQTQVGISWTPGAANDCVFVQWLLETGLVSGGAWMEPTGCIGLSARTTLSCTATGLMCGVQYKFRVTELCADPNADAQASMESAPYSTTACSVQAASVPTTVIAFTTNPKWSTMSVQWSAGSANDCSFRQWDVRSSVDGMIWSSSTTCTATSRPITQCLVENLNSNADYYFKVREQCDDLATDSIFSSTSAVATTAPKPSEPPQNITISGETETTMTLRPDVLGRFAQVSRSCNHGVRRHAARRFVVAV